MSEQLGLGKIITTPQQRDAIHIAVVPVAAGQKLKAGDKVFINRNGMAELGAIGSVGVVDPFLTVSVQHGETFWLYLNPGSITSLRHDWTHPAFPAVAMTAAHAYLEGMADRLGSSLDEVLHAIDAGHFCLPNDLNEYGVELDDVFWANYTAYTGKPKPANDPGYFRCAC